MPSNKEPFSKSVICPATSRHVTLSGVLVSLGNQSEVATKNCSQITYCLQKYGALELEPNCLLHTLRP